MTWLWMPRLVWGGTLERSYVGSVTWRGIPAMTLPLTNGLRSSVTFAPSGD